MTLDIAIVGVMLASTHLGPMSDAATRTLATPGAYVVTESGLTFGAYRNTMRRTSWQAGYTHELSGRWAISAGLVTGYPGTKRAYFSDPSSKYPLPYIAVSYRFGDNSGVRAITMPQRTLPLAVAYEVR